MCVWCAGFSAIYWPYDRRLLYITCCDVTKTLPFVFTRWFDLWNHNYWTSTYIYGADCWLHVTNLLQLIEYFKTLPFKLLVMSALLQNAFYFLTSNLLSCNSHAAKTLIENSLISKNDTLELPASDFNRLINCPCWHLSVFTSAARDECRNIPLQSLFTYVLLFSDDLPKS